MTENEKIDWWQRMAKRRNWPNWGHWMVAPEDTDGEFSLVHGETGACIPCTADKGKTLREEAAFFRKVFPGAQVAAPMTFGDNNPK
jgi:hypothetical protein